MENMKNNFLYKYNRKTMQIDGKWGPEYPSAYMNVYLCMNNIINNLSVCQGITWNCFIYCMYIFNRCSTFYQTSAIFKYFVSHVLYNVEKCCYLDNKKTEKNCWIWWAYIWIHSFRKNYMLVLHKMTAHA